MSNPANQTRRPASKIYGVKIEYESLITPSTLIAAGFRRDYKNGKVRPNVRAFCAAMGIGEDLYHSIKAGRREPTAGFRLRASFVLKRPEESLFRRRIEGQ